jgi:hypothetical protein
MSGSAAVMWMSTRSAWLRKCRAKAAKVASLIVTVLASWSA